MIDISKKIKDLRILNNYTQEQIAELCDVSRQAVAKWESGVNLPDIEKILQLSELFHVSTDELLSKGGFKTEPRTEIGQKNECTIINKALEKAMTCKDTNEGISQFIASVGEQVDFDRISIFEAVDGKYKNTYEWCNKGSTSQMEYQQFIPLAELSSWQKAFSTIGYIFIEDLKNLAVSDPVIYGWLKPQDIKSVLVYPVFGGRGFISVANPAPAFISQTSTIIKLMIHFIEIMLHQRDLIMSKWKWVISQNDQFSVYNKAVFYYVDLTTNQIQYDKEKAVKAGYSFDIRHISDLKELCDSHPEFYDHALIDGFNKVIETKENLSIEFISFKDDKSLRWNRIAVSPFADNTGKVLQLYGMLQDISDSHKIIEQYNKYILSMTGGLHICYLSRPLHLEYASDTLCNFLGYTREEFDQVVGTKYTNAILEEDREIFRSYAQRLGKTPGIESCKYRMVKKDGSIITVIDTMESILDSSGIMCGYAYVLPETQVHVMLDMADEKDKEKTALVEVLETFEKNYLNVFRVWLDEDKTQIVRRKGYVIKDLKKENSDYFSYYKLCKEYIQERVHPDDKEKMLDAMRPDTVRKAFENNDEYTVIYRTLTDNETHFYEYKCVRIPDTLNTKKINFVASFRNIDKAIDEKTANDEKLKSKIDIINTILRAFTCGYYLDYTKDEYVELSNTNANLSRIFGKKGRFDEIRKKLKISFPDQKAFKELDDFLNIKTLNSRLNNQRYATTQIKIKDYGWYELYMFVVDYENSEKIAHCILLARNITEEKKQEIKSEHSLNIAERREREAMHAAYVDSLTKTMNRNAFEKDFKAIGKDKPVGFIFCDVNNLKKTNDKYGHNFGDILLTKFSSLLKRNFSTDCIYRTGGDEFVCMIENIGAEHFSQRVTKITREISENNNIAAIGAIHGNSMRKEFLIHQAEVQMYAMKKQNHMNRE